MQQQLIKGRGASYMAAAEAPKDMPGEVVALCKSEADAITWSINYAIKRYGYRQADIAKLCGWSSDNHLSAYKKAPDGAMPIRRRAVFAHVTGCNLLAQYERTLAPPATDNMRADVALALMLREAA